MRREGRVGHPGQMETQNLEAELLRQVALGDERAFASLYDRYSPILLGILIRMLRDRAEAEDVLQEVFIHIWLRAHCFDEARGRPFTWLVIVTRSRAVDRLRSKRATEQVEMTVALDASWNDGASVDPVAEAAAGEQRQVVMRALAALPEAQRQVLLLGYFSGLTQSEIAGLLDLPLGTIKTRMRSGLIKLRAQMRPEEAEAATNEAAAHVKVDE